MSILFSYHTAQLHF